MRQADLSTSKVTDSDSLPISARIASVMTEAWVMGRLPGRLKPCSYSGAVNPNVCVREHTSGRLRCQTEAVRDQIGGDVIYWSARFFAYRLTVADARWWSRRSPRARR